MNLVYSLLFPQLNPELGLTKNTNLLTRLRQCSWRDFLKFHKLLNLKQKTLVNIMAINNRLREVTWNVMRHSLPEKC